MSWKIGSGISQINELTQYTTVVAAENTFILDSQNKPVKNFRITIADANAKAIAVSNIPSGNSELFVELTYTSAAAITRFSGITWLSGSAPIFTVGKVYRIAFFTSNGGTTSHGNSVGGW